MAATLRCDRCKRLSPSDARFCIECGYSLAPAATGKTVKLSTARCPTCGALSPVGAHFCVACGAPFAGGQRPGSVQQRPTAQQSYPRTSANPTPIHRNQQRQQHGPWIWCQGGPNIPALLLTGIVFLLMTGMIWPGILLALGIAHYLSETHAGRQDHGLKGLLWLGGLTLLIATHTFWPGIIVLILLNWIIDDGHRHIW